MHLKSALRELNKPFRAPRRKLKTNQQMNLQTETIGRFQIYGDWAPELLPPLRQLLERFEHFLPNWCHIAYVKFDGDAGDDCAWCDVNMSYRRVNLGFGESFFRSDDSERAEMLIHELMHANTLAIINCAKEALQEALGDNEVALKFVGQRMDEANEGATCDLTALIGRLMETEEAI